MALAEISATAAEVTRVPALLGRTLIASDEAPDAPPVAVVSYDVWQRRLGGDPEVIGRTIRIGREDVTLVGVMPDGYGFPVAQDVWVPLRLNALEYQRGEAPMVEVFGRLSPGVSLREAQAELTAIGARTAADAPGTHQHLRPRVMPFAKTVLNLGAVAAIGVLSMNLFIIALLLLVCGNVALLMFARAATRESEIVVRNALGASRGRIVAQMFAEALVLAALAGALGLAGASYGLRWGMDTVLVELLDGVRLPFWFNSTLSVGSVVYAVALTVVAAVIAGVIPALKMTGPGLEGRLRAGGAGGGGPRFGGLWTGIIVVQIAVTVVFPLLTYMVQADMRRIEAYDVGFAADRYLSARLEVEDDPAALRGQSPGWWVELSGSAGDAAGSPDTSRAALAAYARSVRAELERRLLEDPAVTGVTLASALPRQYHGWNQIELDEGAVPPPDTVRGHRVSKAFIAADYLSVLGREVVAGRSFHTGDVESGARVAIVNEAFVEKVLGGKNPIGRRVRYAAGEGPGSSAQEQPWHEIVGVAPDLGMTSGYGDAGIYHPAPADGSYDEYLIVGVTGDARPFAPVLQRTAVAVDPTLRLHDVMSLDVVDDAERQFYDFWLTLSAVLTGLVLVLSWAGIYAVMSFTVSRRTREIGIRVAVGGAASRVLLAILRRPLTQVAMGVALGAAVILAVATVFSDPGTGPSLADIGLVLLYACGMLVVCLLACVVPGRRALSVEPTEALRAE